MSRRAWILSLGGLILAAMASQAMAQDYFPPPESQGGWRSLVTPNVPPSAEEKAQVLSLTGLNWDRLLLAQNHSASFDPVATVLVIRNGWIAGDWGDNRQIVASYSMGKSWVSLAMAKVFDLSEANQLPNGQRIGPESFAYLYLPAQFDTPQKRLIKIKHLMTMSSGLRPANGGDIPPSMTYWQWLLSQPVEAAPESDWKYDSGSADLVSYILQRVTGLTTQEFFDQHINSPIGADPIWQWLSSPDADGTSYNVSSAVYFSPRDVARVGYLMLQNGAWRNQPIVSSSRVSMLSQWASFLEGTGFSANPFDHFKPPTNSQTFYGHSWWTNQNKSGLGAAVPPDAYCGYGFGNKIVCVIPSLNMVVARFSNQGVDQPDYFGFAGEFMSLVVAAVEGGGNQAPSVAIPSPVQLRVY